MRLIKLSANNSGFKTVEFNRTGLSIIIGRRHNSDYTQNRKSTYNSVGKSFTIALIHFCLGSSKNPEFETKLSEWEFTLKFEIDNSIHIASRKCNDQNKIILDGEEKGIKEYTDFLANKVFAIPAGTKYISFRSLIPRFIRQKKASYNSYDNFIPEESEFAKLLNNSFLLGLVFDQFNF